MKNNTTKKLIIVTAICFLLSPLLICAAELVNPLGDVHTPSKLIGNVISSLLLFLGALATLMFIYGGFTLILSGGNPERIKKGQTTIVWAIIGLAVVLSSYGIMEFIFKALATGSVGE